MKRIVLFPALILAISLVAGPAFAADEGLTPRFEITPSFSIGYVRAADEIVYSLDTGTPGVGGIGGVTRRDYTYRDFSQLFIEGGLDLDIGDRFGTAVVTRWALPIFNNDVRADDFDGPLLGGRAWRAKTLWAVVDGNVSYDLVADPDSSFSFEPKVGVRWDYWRIWYDDPHSVSPVFPVASPDDTADFYSSAVMPYAGFTATVGGLQRGMWGGDLVIDAAGGFLAWGRAQHKETRDLGGTRHDTFEGRLDKGFFYELSIDYTVLTLDFSPKVQGTVGLFGKLSGFHVEGDLDGTRSPVVEADDFHFDMQRHLLMTGISMAVTFDIFGKPQPIPTPEPAPVIEPKLEPMSKN